MASDINQQIAALDLDTNTMQDAPQIALDVDSSFNLREFERWTRRLSVMSLPLHASTVTPGR